ncbi:MAG TPA: MinD/ParA family protein [Aggregatilineales bacterium]|nr:MinD/ParA family protein [Aggregatilineales bacterium]
MAKIISIHSFRGGTGKSNLTANLAVLLATEGKRVAVVDTDLQSPGIHVLFGLKQQEVKHSLNEYLFGQCEISQAAHDVTANLNRHDGDQAESGVQGQIFLIPASMKTGEIARVLREGCNVDVLRDGIRRLVSVLKLDVLLIDTHPGINEETLLSIASSDALVVIMRPDQQDYQGTHVTLEVARKLGVKRLMIVVNKAPKIFRLEDIRTQVAQTYNCQVGAVLPHSDTLMNLGSAEVFVLRYPDHAITGLLKDVANLLTQ